MTRFFFVFLLAIGMLAQEDSNEDLDYQDLSFKTTLMIDTPDGILMLDLYLLDPNERRWKPIEDINDGIVWPDLIAEVTWPEGDPSAEPYNKFEPATVWLVKKTVDIDRPEEFITGIPAGFK